MAQQGNTSWEALRRQFSVDEARAAFYDRVIGLQLELARRLEGCGVDGDTVMRVLEDDNDRLETMVRAGAKVDIDALTEELLAMAGERAPE